MVLTPDVLKQLKNVELRCEAFPCVGCDDVVSLDKGSCAFESVDQVLEEFFPRKCSDLLLGVVVDRRGRRCPLNDPHSKWEEGQCGAWIGLDTERLVKALSESS